MWNSIPSVERTHMFVHLSEMGFDPNFLASNHVFYPSRQVYSVEDFEMIPKFDYYIFSSNFYIQDSSILLISG